MTIIEFLEARIAEDEEAARAAAWQDCGWEARGDSVCETLSFGADCIARCDESEEAAHIARHDPARVLAECAAKRRILAMADGSADFQKAMPRPGYAQPFHSPSIDILMMTARLLASVYADHPDYWQEWAA